MAINKETKQWIIAIIIMILLVVIIDLIFNRHH